MDKNNNGQDTLHYDLESQRSVLVKNTMQTVINALSEKGYNPINQIVGYITSGDPTYITSYNGARSAMRKIERDDLLEEMVSFYLNHIED